MNNFIVNEPISGEDAIPVANDRMLIVCDGLGGGGSSIHMVGENRYTSAQLASRYVSEAVQSYVDNYYEALFENTDSEIMNLKGFIFQYLQEKIKEYDLKKTVRGAAIKLLPTTLASVIYKEEEDHVEVITVWAGDSRIYMLTPEKGLQQVSMDDAAGEFDAYRDIGNSTMTNCIYGEKLEGFRLNYRKFTLEKTENLILFCASDGCFDYISSPMEFEWFLLYIITKAKGLNEKGISFIGTLLGNNLKKYYHHDDCSMAAKVFFMREPEDLQRAFHDRYEKYVCENHRVLSVAVKENRENSAKRDELSMNLGKHMRTFPDLLQDTIIRGMKNDNLLEGLPLYLSQLPACKDYYGGYQERKKQIHEMNLQYKELVQEQSRKMGELYPIFCQLVSHDILYNNRIPDDLRKFRRNIEMIKSRMRTSLQVMSESQERHEKLKESITSMMDTYWNLFFQKRGGFEQLERAIANLEGSLEKTYHNYEKYFRFSVQAEEGQEELMKLLVPSVEMRDFFVKAYKSIDFDNALAEKYEIQAKELSKVEEQANALKSKISEMDTGYNAEQYYQREKKQIVEQLFQLFPQTIDFFSKNEQEAINPYISWSEEKRKLEEKIEASNRKMDEIWENGYKKNYEYYRFLWEDGGQV